MLSNNGPDDPFNEGADAKTVKRENVRKIIILMTDGRNRIAPGAPGRPGVDPAEWAYRDHSWRCGANENACDASRYADDMLKRLCERIRADNPATGRPHAEIITITFDVKDENIKRLLRDCASLGSHDAGSGELSRVFDNIASSLMELHLSR